MQTDSERGTLHFDTDVNAHVPLKEEPADLGTAQDTNSDSDCLTGAEEEEHRKSKSKGWCSCCETDMNVERTVFLNGMTIPKNKISNAVNNQKYNIISFLPIVLFNQFKLFFNFFQLAINLSQFIPILKVGFLFTYLAPLIMVLVFTLAK